MGQYTEGTIQIEAKSEEIAIKIVEKINNIDRYLRVTKKETDFDVSINDIDADGTIVNINLSSGRYQNLEWQLDQVFEMCKDLFDKQMVSFVADYTIPENYIYQEWDEDGKEI